MKTIGDEAVHVVGNDAYVSRYEVAEAFFRTEEEENMVMAIELNKMINVFCEEERQTKRNVIALPFNTETYKQAIDYINNMQLNNI